MTTFDHAALRGSAQAGSSKRETEISLYITRLEAATNAVTSAAGVLVGRLELVLRPEPPTPAKNQKDEVNRGPETLLGRVLAQKVHQLDTVYQQLCDANDRLEL